MHRFGQLVHPMAMNLWNHELGDGKNMVYAFQQQQVFERKLGPLIWIAGGIILAIVLGFLNSTSLGMNNIVGVKAKFGTHAVVFERHLEASFWTDWA